MQWACTHWGASEPKKSGVESWLHGLSRIISRVIQNRHCRRAAQKTSTKRKATQLLLTPALAAAAALCTKVGPLGYNMVLWRGWGVRFMQRSCTFCLGVPRWALPLPVFLAVCVMYVCENPYYSMIMKMLTTFVYYYLRSMAGFMIMV